MVLNLHSTIQAPVLYYGELKQVLVKMLLQLQLVTLP